MTSTALAHDIEPSEVSNPNPERLEQDQGNEEIPGHEEKLLDNGPSASGPATHVALGKDEETDVATPNVSDHPECAEQDRGNKETARPGGQLLKDVPSSSSSGSAAHRDENEETVITRIQATDVPLGLRRIPAGFYTVVHHSGREWRTENKRSSVDNDVLEWGGPIPLPSDLSATVCLGIYASFEFQPILGGGEQLRTLTVTVQQLLDRSAQDIPFRFFPKDGDVVSPCSSLLVTVGRQKRERGDLSESRVHDPNCSTTRSWGKLEDTTNQGHSALSRYRKHGVKRNLDVSIEQFERALDVCLLDHPCRAAAQANMAMAKFIRCRVGDTDHSLEVPLMLYRNALVSRPVGHPDRPSTLIQLATVHLARFEKWQDEADATQAEELLREAMDISSADSHENRAAIFMLQLHAGRKMGAVQEGGQSSVERDSASGLIDWDPWSLGVQLLRRFERFGGLDDLQRAILEIEACLGSTSVWGQRYIAGQTNLGVALSYRFDQLGELSDLEQAISRFGIAVDLTPDGQSDKSGRLNNLGNCILTRFERLGELCDLEQAISRLGDAVALSPRRDPDKPGCLNNLGRCFLTRFERLGELGDLELAISKLRDALELTPDRHPHKPSCLLNLGHCFVARFSHLGELGDLEQAMSSHRDAVDLTPDCHPHKPTYLNNLGSCFMTRFSRFGELGDLEQAISRHKDAVDLTPHRHPDNARHLCNLGNCFMARFSCLGELDDLEQGKSRLRDAVGLTPDRHPDKPGRLNNLGLCFRARFERLGELGDLEQAISSHRDALDLTPDRHPDKPTCLNSLGNCFMARFERLGELGDLEQAISRHKDAVDLTPDCHPDKPGRLNNLGTSFVTRFSRLGEPCDLEQAISRLGDVVDLTPDGRPDKPGSLNNLGSCLLKRFERFGELGDLEQAISRLSDAVNLTPDRHPHKYTCLNNLSLCSRARFERLGELGDLEQAISRLRDALDLAPHRHPHERICLINLGNCFLIRFERLGELCDLEQAISRVRGALDLTPVNHPDKPTYLHSLASCFLTRFNRLEELRDLEQATSLSSHAACASTGSTTTRFSASLLWISCARASGHHSLLHAYSVAIDLLPHLAWIGLPLANRYSELIQGADVVREAAAAALDSGLPQTAVEWLEQGRSIVWGELFQLRSSHAELSSVHPDLASRLQDLSAALEHSGATRETLLSSLSEQTPSAPESLEQQADRHRALAIERDQLLQDIRTLPGFGRFLLQKQFCQLRASAHSGPVVMLNAAESRCDALVVLADADDVIHVPLPNFTLDRSKRLQNALQSLLRHATSSDEREGQRVQRKDVTWVSVLSVLWNNVVKPVLDALAFSTPGDLSRIFWCPTGPFAFLPIHAAGLYGTQSSDSGHKVSDFVISSYIPTLSILVPSSEINAPSSDHLRLLTVRQPLSDGQGRLPGVNTELRHIRNVIQGSLSARTTLLESSIGTVEEVLSLMKEADWVHFACHGLQDGVNPTESGLCLANKRRLKLSDIIALSRPRGGLAFLSACETAMGDKDLSDEALHIAAGMLFAGYGGVVGTMWSISDRLAPLVAKDVYEQLFRNGTRPDHREAARALHHAVGRLRDNRASFDEWLPFIHVGL